MFSPRKPLHHSLYVCCAIHIAVEQGAIVAAAVGDPSGVDAVELGLVADVRTYPGDDMNLTYSKSPMAMKQCFVIGTFAIGSH